ncbi:peptidase inhibitor family I36 protein [Streptomyces sp. NPDC003327]
MRTTSLLRRLAIAVTALGLTTAGLLGAGAVPAQAAIEDCPAGYFCAWKSYDGTGTMFKTNENLATLGAWDNTFRSVVNHTRQYVCLYDAPNHDPDGGYDQWVPDPAGTEWGYSQGSVSSVKFVPTSRECHLPPHPAWSAPVAPKAAGFGDMNADRRPDVLVRDEAGRLWYLSGDNTSRLIGTGGWNIYNGLTRHGDFSRDGREDVVAREAATGKLWLYPGTGTGAVGSRKLIGSGGWNAMNTLVAPGDMNGDGRADLYAREAATGKLWLYPGMAGHLGARVLIGSGGWNVMDSFLTVGDWSADGRNDLATVTTSDYVTDSCRGVGCLVLYPGRGTGGLYAGVPEDGDWYHLNGVF